jgi:hypothetical protein
LQGKQDIHEIHTAEFPDGKWAAVILILKKDGTFEILKKKGLSVYDEMEVSRVVKTWMDAYGLERKKIKFHGMH